MKKQTLFKFFAYLILLFSGYAQAATSFSNVYIFGDSLSDTGNLASVTQDFPAPPFYMNRVSNGPVAVDNLAAQLGHSATASLHLLGLNAGGNYAVAGADAFGTDPVDLGTQIISFQANHGFIAPPNALYVMFIGGNDVRTAALTTNKDDAKAIVMAAANEVYLAIESLSQAGAKYFLLINAPDIGRIPETQLIAVATSNPDLPKFAHKLSKQYRKALHKLSEQLEDKKQIEIIEFDLFKFFNKLVKQADKHGFTNTTDACFSTLNSNFITMDLVFHPDCNSGLNFDQFIFFDEIHPTARVHAMTGNAMAKAVLDEIENEDEDDDDNEDEDDD